jgi:iron complex transport system ATP-binding protein
MTAVIEVIEASISFGRHAVLDSVSITVGRGEIVGVVGPNGAGKTTLLKVAMGALRPSAGRVLLNGANAFRLSAAERARVVAHVPQNPNVPEGFTALEVVLMGRTPHLGFLRWEGAQDLKLAMAAMEATGTDGLADRWLGSLSGGEAQRVFVARALAQEPVVLALDEPTTHLDLGYQISVMDSVARARRERWIGVLVAMHDVTLAAQYCDRVLMLASGRIRAEGTPHEVLRPELLSTVFDASVTVIPHPVSGMPVALASRRRVNGRGGPPATP